MEPKRKNTTDAERSITEKELTDKFLSGELTFSEYSERWSLEHVTEDDDDEETVEEIEFEGESSHSVVEKKVPQRRIRKQLPAALSGLMGEANLRYARGDRDMAEKMCYEIIRQMPLTAEPYHTLAQIYEADQDKSLQFSLIAAHLNPSDGDQWVRLANLSKEKNDLKQAVLCYSKAINANPKQLAYHNGRLDLIKYIEQNKSNEEKKVLLASKLTSQICLTRMMGWYPETEGKTVLHIGKTVAQEYHAMNNIAKACHVMDKAYSRFPKLFTFEDLNLYLELLLAMKQYDKCINIFVAHCEVEVETEMQYIVNGDIGETVTNIVNCSIPATLPIDLHTKLFICLIHLKAFHLIEPFLDELISNEDVETTGDIYLDVEEALTSEKCHEKAFRLLQVLVKSSRYSLPAVWLKYAECLSALDRKLEAINAYKTVVDLAPQHIDARFKLSTLLLEANRMDEALIALEQNEYTDVLDTGLLYERCKILKQKGDLRQYLKVGELLLSRHFFVIRNRDELAAFKTKDTGDTLREIREARGENFEEANPFVFEDGHVQLTLQMDYDLLNDLLETAYNMKEYTTMERLSFSAMGSKKFHEHKMKLEFSALLSCIYNKDYNFAFMMIREFFIAMTRNKGVLNTFNMIIQRSLAQKHNKFLTRCMQREESENISLRLLYANCCLIAGTYKNALKEYINCYKYEATALNTLLCGVSMIHMACQKFSTNRHTLVLQCMAFLSQYENLRGPDGRQEVFYNIGRAYHQLGLMNLACQYYKRALEVKVNFECPESDVLDLRREIAFNLYLIYKDDAPEVSRMYLEKYIII